MKKLWALISLLIIVPACSKPTINTANLNTNKPVETKPATGPSEAEITAKEKDVWDAIEKKYYAVYSAALDNDYVEVTADGVFDKSGVVNTVKELTLSDVTFSDWKFLPIDKDAVIVTYTVSYKGSFQGKAFPPASMRATSLWMNRGGKWLSVYHQETEVAPPPKTPPPAGKPGPSPASKPVETTTGPDVAADEKLVWDALKAANFDAFGNFLAPEFIEVEADGVFDRAASTKDLSQMDFTKAELSEWKTVKLNDNVSLVTYLAKIPGFKPDRGRHSTIWVNRSGKWLALFHHGTPISTAMGK